MVSILCILTQIYERCSYKIIIQYSIISIHLLIICIKNSYRRTAGHLGEVTEDHIWENVQEEEWPGDDTYDRASKLEPGEL